ncbi:uncharacterized protein LOC125225626 [Leguminivora glycinivorella]|uniref:uncharacterized protein LOC125225626 n=1 Tax=Leguminivora glycinivorella TaxID=1035111 RepID=UPI00200FAECA|nr:uncharacterized protein LOC125225626 [Leguminivora glycinivorella]
MSKIILFVVAFAAVAIAGIIPDSAPIAPDELSSPPTAFDSPIKPLEDPTNSSEDQLDDFENLKPEDDDTVVEGKKSVVKQSQQSVDGVPVLDKKSTDLIKNDNGIVTKSHTDTDALQPSSEIESDNNEDC